MTSLQMAMVYNRVIGGNITHRDVEEWGLLEEAEILNAMNLMGKKEWQQQ